MPLNFNGTNITAIKYNGTNLTKVVFNGTTVWESASWHTVWTGSVVSRINSTSYTTYSYSVSGLRTNANTRVSGKFYLSDSNQESFSSVTYFNGNIGLLSAVSVANASTLNVTAYKKSTSVLVKPFLYITKIEQYY